MSIEEFGNRFDFRAIAESYGFGSPWQISNQQQNWEIDIAEIITKINTCEKIDMSLPGIRYLRIRPMDNSLQISFRGSETKFEWERRENSWELSHRFVDHSERNKNIGSKLIKLGEKIIQIITSASQEAITIFLESGQINVWGCLLKNGYTVIENQQKEFDDLLQRLEEKDPNLSIDDCGYVDDGMAQTRFKFVKNIVSLPSSIEGLVDETTAKVLII